MKKYLAVFTGAPDGKAAKNWTSLSPEAKKEREQAGMKAWGKWAQDNAKSIIEMGAPLGKTKQIDPNGISDIRNNLTAFTIVQAESHESAAKMFLEHPHFSIFPGDTVEIMECLPMPGPQ